MLKVSTLRETGSPLAGVGSFGTFAYVFGLFLGFAQVFVKDNEELTDQRLFLLALFLQKFTTSLQDSIKINEAEGSGKM